MKTEKLSLVWLRRDLRLDDNAAIYHALRSGNKVLPLFIFDPNILNKLEDKNDHRVQFIFEQLEILKVELEKIGSTLLVLNGDPLSVFSQIIKDFTVAEVFANHDYERSAIARDAAIKDLLLASGITIHTFKDHCIFEKKEVVKDDLKPYTVFTPYKKKWLAALSSFYLKSYDCRKYFANWAQAPKKKYWVQLSDIGFVPDLKFNFPPLVFDRNELKDYAKTRDFPSLNSTSRLGLHLRFGTVSIRECASIAKKWSDTWLSELIWRDFFMQIIFHFPHVVQGAFRPEYDQIEWRNSDAEFAAWCEGRTGYPFVDAGMRELNVTGFMHNRVRMITASFLTKHLLIDWRWGERYFARRLLDYDLSANNGNWQWAAGTGCDAAPYFRVFSPELQLKRFDKDLVYVKKWVPEFGTSEYPSPIVEHSFARDRAIATYKKALKKA